MTPLRATELSRIQAVNTAWLEQTATITRPDGGQSSDGYPDGTPSTVASGVACRVEPAKTTGRENTVAAGAAAGAEWDIIFSYSVAEIRPQDSIAVSGITGTFEVQSATSARGVQTDVVARCVKREAA